MAAAAPRVQPGVTMAELRDEVEAQMREAGSLTPSFATHIFTGMHPGSLDTGTATAHTPLPDGTAVLFDFGGVVDGYCSDFGRTVVAGSRPAISSTRTRRCSSPSRPAGRPAGRVRSPAT